MAVSLTGIASQHIACVIMWCPEFYIKRGDSRLANTSSLVGSVFMFFHRYTRNLIFPSVGPMNTVAVLVTVHVVAGQAILQQTNRNENDITLKCLDKNEEPILNATFHRNGATLADDPCFSADNIVASSDGSAIAITVSPPCEGYFMCSEEKRVIVSLPIAIYGMSRDSLYTCISL